MYSISVFIVLPLKKNNEYIYYNINSCEFQQFKYDPTTMFNIHEQ